MIKYRQTRYKPTKTDSTNSKVFLSSGKSLPIPIAPRYKTKPDGVVKTKKAKRKITEEQWTLMVKKNERKLEKRNK